MMNKTLPNIFPVLPVLGSKTVVSVNFLIHFTHFTHFTHGGLPVDLPETPRHQGFRIWAQRRLALGRPHRFLGCEIAEVPNFVPNFVPNTRISWSKGFFFWLRTITPAWEDEVDFGPSLPRLSGSKERWKSDFLTFGVKCTSACWDSTCGPASQPTNP